MNKPVSVYLEYCEMLQKRANSQSSIFGPCVAAVNGMCDEDRNTNNYLPEKKDMSGPVNMSNKQLRMIVSIEKHLFEKKNQSFEQAVKQAKEKSWP